MVSDIICSICVLFLLCFITCAKADVLDKCNDDGIYCETRVPTSGKCTTPTTCRPVLVLTDYTAEDGSVSITVGLDSKDSVCAVLAFSEDKTDVSNIGTLIFMKGVAVTVPWTVLYMNSDGNGGLDVQKGTSVEDSVKVLQSTSEDYSVYTFKILKEISGDNGVGKISPNVTYYYNIYDGVFKAGPDCQNVVLTNPHTVSENKYMIAASADKAMLAGYTLLTGLIFLILQH